MSKTLLAGGTGLTLSTNTLSVDAAQTQITSVGTLTALTGGTGDFNWSSNTLVVDHSESKVGIGTATPANKLEILHGTVGTGNNLNNTLALRYNATTMYGQHYCDGNGIYHIRADAQGISGGNLALGGDTSVQLWTGGTPSTRMIVDSAGNVGIGTAAPVSTLDVAGTTGITWGTTSATDAFKGLVTIGSQGTSGASLVVRTAGVNANEASGLGIDGTYAHPVSTVNIKAYGVNHSSYSSNLAFFTQSGTSLTERMRITSAGYVGINKTPGSHQLDVEGKVRITGNTAELLWVEADSQSPLSCRISATSSYDYRFYAGGSGIQLESGSWVDSSDERLKHDIEDIEYGLETVNNLKPRKFKWNDHDRDDIGFISQEIMAFIPEVVSEPNPSGMYNLNYQHLTSVLCKAIQELSAKVTALENA